MNINILQPKSIFAAQISKSRTGSVKIDLFTTSELDIYVVTGKGFEDLKKTQKISSWETKLRTSVSGNFSNSIKLQTGLYYLVLHNKGDKIVNFNFDIYENFEPPGMSGVTGTSGTFIN